MSDDDRSDPALRRRAEEKAARNPKSLETLAPEDARRLLHELQVHQIELEMQNEELRRTQLELETSWARYFDLYDLAPVGYLTLNEAGLILEANLTAATLLGVARSVLVRQPFSRFIAPEDQDLYFRQRKALFDTEAPRLWELRLLRKDGSAFWARLEAAAAREPDGAPVRRIALSDISAQKQAEAALRLQSAALNAAANSIVITDRAGKIEWINAAFTRTSGYTSEEAIGKNPRDLVKSGAHEQGVYEDLWETVLAGKVWHGELTNRRKDGSLHPEELTITPVKDADGETVHFIAIGRDLTEQKRLEAQFLEAQKLETVGKLAGGIAHDFNNLLGVINGTAELALLEVDESFPLRVDLQQIRQAGERAGSLTRQLLAFSRKQILRPSVLDLGALIADLRSQLESQLGEDIDLVVLTSKGASKVRADSGQIEQVLLSLAGHARKAMPAGGTWTIEVRDVGLDEAGAAVQAAGLSGAQVMLELRDTGFGMDEATRRRLFEPFFTSRELGQGTGLGLATVYGIVHQSGGSIRVDSNLGQGTSFRIYLPRIDEEPRPLQPGKLRSLAKGTETILVVDDEEALLELAERILKSVGYTVLTAGSAEEALAVLVRNDPPVQLILTDVVLPGMNGRELAERAVQVQPGLKILLTSGYTDDAVLRAGVQRSSTRFLPKPYSLVDLTSKLRELLD